MYARLVAFGLVYLLCHRVQAQEFPKGWVVPLELGQGLRTVPALHTELYVASVQLAPMYAIVPGSLRLGASLGGFYANRRIEGLAGPRLALKLTDGAKFYKSTIYNVQLIGEHIWATHDIRLWGGGFALELGQLATFSIRAYQEYRHHEFWLQTTIGLNLNSLRKETESDDPFR